MSHEVHHLQYLLVCMKFLNLSDYRLIFGKFGHATRNALQHFQRSTGLLADGIYGPKTEAKMYEVVTTFRSSVFKFFLDDHQIL